MDRTESLRRRDKAVIWHPFTQMADWEKDDPIVIERGEGNYLFDTDGNRYFDGVSSLWVNLFGHRRKEIDDAVRAQLDLLAHSTFLGLSHPPAIELAEKLLALAPPGLSRVFYSDNGSTAMEIAIKMAFQYWRQKGNGEKKKTFLTLSEAYHGDTIGSISAGGIDLFHKIFRPLLFSTRRIPTPHCYRCPFGLSRPSCGLHCADRMEEEIHTAADSLAAAIVEPLVQGAAGMLMMPEGYLGRLRAVTRQCGVLLVCDEVATGFCRTGTMFACEQEGVSPDILALAKGLTGGYLPLAATLTTEEIYRMFLGRYEEYKTFFHGHSYTANPLGCAAALGTLSIFEGEDIPARVSALSAIMAMSLSRLAGQPNVGDIRQKGLMAGIEIVADRKTKERFPPELRLGQKMVRKAREKGILLRPLGDVIVLMPPLSSTESEVEGLVDVTAWAIGEVLG
ncbi:MAG: adenosylmethionine--8-amino-7-oxononanoate transaminase [Deltaproteobacteria bacterium RBG_16_64_85]|nr:MAG: adenosylmethionine--8-amino-7-oxononanoate transaminase [Deltaproteobacteria bacterium RBG_16_64_85]